MKNVISFIDAAIHTVKQAAPGSQTVAFLIGVCGQFGVRGLVASQTWTRRPTKEETARVQFNACLAAWAHRVLGDEWLSTTVDDTIEYRKTPRPLDASGVAMATTSGVFGNLAEAAATKQAKRETGRVQDLEAREHNITHAIWSEITRTSAERGEIDAQCDDRTAVTLLGALFVAAQGCAINAEARKHSKMPAIAASGVLEVGALMALGCLLNNEVAKILDVGDGYVAPYELNSAEAWAARDEDSKDEELDRVFAETQARTRDLAS